MAIRAFREVSALKDIMAIRAFKEVIALKVGAYYNGPKFKCQPTSGTG